MYTEIIQCFRTNRSTAINVLLLSLLFVALFSTSAIAFSTSAIAVDDAYLKALEVEAEKSADLNDNVDTKVNGQTKSNPGLPLDKKELMQFELELKASRPATYRFYKKLDSQEKTLVFTIYKEDQKMTRASKTVFDLYFDKNK
ncbi:hypothetical protein [Kaarinaea lacus]